jgi:hypothetical protein
MFESSATPESAAAESRQRSCVGVRGGRVHGGIRRTTRRRADRDAAAADAGGAAGPDSGAVLEVVPPRPSLPEAIAGLEAAIAAFDAVDWARESDRAVNDAAVALQRVVNRVQARALRPLAVMQRRESFTLDGAATAASWLRTRARLDPAAASRLCTAARRLRGLPLLRKAFLDGAVTLAHVTAITEAAVPNRHEAIARVEEPLVDLARRVGPRSLHPALRRIRGIVDRDGTPDAAGGEGLVEDEDDGFDADERDPRRYWQQYRTIDGMVEGRYLLDGVFGEMLLLLFDAFSTADPADTPLQQRRSPAQQRVDAMRAAVMTLLEAGLAPSVGGNKAHLLLMLDLHTVMGRDQAAVFASELRRTGRVSAATIARLGIDAKITPVLTMGPYRVVAVGRTHRTLPAWLRPMLEMLHRRCRGPDCDRPACWAEAHHEKPWAEGGETDLNDTVPLCQRHHRMVTHEGWTVTLDNDTGICTWTAPNGRVIRTYPER